jgi:endonuclease/exonuclease/phosphatase family metal-dependent hydrolase
VGWASRPSFLDGRDAHPTIIIKIVSYLIRAPKSPCVGEYKSPNAKCLKQTWPTFRPLAYIPIAHFLVSKEIGVLKIRAGRNVGSDHLPLITDLVI